MEGRFLSGETAVQAGHGKCKDPERGILGGLKENKDNGFTTQLEKEGQELQFRSPRPQHPQDIGLTLRCEDFGCS